MVEIKKKIENKLGICFPNSELQGTLRARHKKKHVLKYKKYTIAYIGPIPGPDIQTRFWGTWIGGTGREAYSIRRPPSGSERLLKSLC